MAEIREGFQVMLWGVVEVGEGKECGEEGYGVLCVGEWWQVQHHT